MMLCVYGAVKRDATLLDFECCVRLHTLLYVVGSCCIRLQVAYDQIAHVRYINYKISNITLRFYGHFSLFGLVFFVLNSPLEIAQVTQAL